MTNEQQHLIYFSTSGKPTLVPPADAEAWIAERAAEAVCVRIGRNTVTAEDILAQFDVWRCLWGFSPAHAARWIADQYYQSMFASREED